MPPPEFVDLQEIASELGGRLVQQPTYNDRDWNLITAYNPSALPLVIDGDGWQGAKIVKYPYPEYEYDMPGYREALMLYEQNKKELRRRAAIYFLQGCTNIQQACQKDCPGNDLWQGIAPDRSLMLICLDTKRGGYRRDMLVLLGIYNLNDLGFNSMNSFHLWLQNDKEFMENPTELELFYKLHERRLQYLEPHFHDSSG